MRIGIVGAGNIGATAARLFADAGHDVVISNSRGPESLRAEEDDGIRAGTVEEAVEHGELVLLAIPLKAYADLPAEAFEDRIVVDATNYYAGRDGEIPELARDETTSTELIGRHLEGARMVKAFNTLRAGTLEEAGRPAGDHSRLAMLVAGDDLLAKRTVMELVDEVGFDPVDTGDLAEGGRAQQPGASLYGAEVTSIEAHELLGGD
jgi:predicted dinucleotide-binding enzyme